MDRLKIAQTLVEILSYHRNKTVLILTAPGETRGVQDYLVMQIEHPSFRFEIIRREYLEEDGNKIHIKSIDNLERIRGIVPDRVLMDDYVEDLVEKAQYILSIPRNKGDNNG